MTLLQMSFSGAVLILAVVILRAAAIHKLPKRTFLTLWEIVLFRLLIPFSIPSVFSVYSLVNQPGSLCRSLCRRAEAARCRHSSCPMAACRYGTPDFCPGRNLVCGKHTLRRLFYNNLSALPNGISGIFSCLQRFHGKMAEGAYAEADRFHPAVRQDFGPPYLWNVTSGHTVAGNKRLGKYTTAGIHSSA